MEQLFIKILNMSISASFLMLAVILIRPFLCKAPKWIPCLLWGFVAIRLICPFSIESAFSLLPSGETIRQTTVSSGDAANLSEQAENSSGQTSSLPGRLTLNSGIKGIDDTINPLLSSSAKSGKAEGKSSSSLEAPLLLSSVIWLIGVSAILCYAGVTFLFLRLKLRISVPFDAPVSETEHRKKEKIYLCDEITTPFIIGVLSPRICLPSSITQEEVVYVLKHERAHLKHKDHLLKAVGFLLLAVHWFNPLVWISYHLFNKDLELACDERVISRLELPDRKRYADTLLACSTQKRTVMVYPLAFGEISIKKRIREILRYKRPMRKAIVIAAAACISLAVCFLTNPLPGKITATVTESAHTKSRINANPNYEPTFSVNDWLSFQLPDGYSLGHYQDTIGFMGGQRILPMVYEVEKTDFGNYAPEDWMSAGLVERIPMTRVEVSYKNGLPEFNGSHLPIENHTSPEKIKIRKPAGDTGSWPAFMLKETHDLYTASEMAELEEKGIDIDKLEVESSYWSFYFVKKGADMCYHLTLSTKVFSQEEAEQIADTVRIKE